VAELALSLFDQLRDQHRLDDSDRSLLLAAGVLHDIGQYVSNEGHHKHSLYLLANSDLPGLTERQMLLVANISRYHRKSEPAAHHESFAKLSDTEQGRVRRLSAILRLADALDRDHLQRVKRVAATVTKGELVLGLEAPGDLLLERWALQRKADFFAKVFGLKVHVVTRVEAT
jgi:exopolyphosphatase/guanosine-5'-triphosphate,3'-diphosphate pyrophosphatase